MKVVNYGPNAWLIQERETTVFINPTDRTTRSFSESMLRYRGTELEFDYPSNCDALIITSDQFQFFDPASVMSQDTQKIVPVTSVLPMIEATKFEVLMCNEPKIIGELRITFFGATYPSTFWDISGVSVLVEGLKTGKSFFFQGSNSLDFVRGDKFPTPCDLSVVTWNTYSTIDPSSAYCNLYHSNEYFSLKHDAGNFISYLSKCPVSKYVTLQGNEFLSSTGSNFRRSVNESVDFLAPYMIGTELVDIMPGSGFNLENEEAFKIEERQRGLCVPVQTVRSADLESHEIIHFLESLAEMVLLTPFGKEVFGCSTVGSKLTSSRRFCFLIRGIDDTCIGFAFDIASCTFLPLGETSIKVARKAYPFGILLNLSDLSEIQAGQVDPWPILNSPTFMQWYLCEPKAAPVTLLFQFWKEVRTKDRFIKYARRH